MLFALTELSRALIGLGIGIGIMGLFGCFFLWLKHLEDESDRISEELSRRGVGYPKGPGRPGGIPPM